MHFSKSKSKKVNSKSDKVEESTLTERFFLAETLPLKVVFFFFVKLPLRKPLFCFFTYICRTI